MRICPTLVESLDYYQTFLWIFPVQLFYCDVQRSFTFDISGVDVGAKRNEEVYYFVGVAKTSPVQRRTHFAVARVDVCSNVDEHLLEQHQWVGFVSLRSHVEHTQLRLCFQSGISAWVEQDVDQLRIFMVSRKMYRSNSIVFLVCLIELAWYQSIL